MEEQPPKTDDEQPNVDKSKPRSIRFPTDLQLALEAEAQRTGRTVNNLVVLACRELLRENGDKHRAQPGPVEPSVPKRKPRAATRPVMFWSDDYVTPRRAVLSTDRKRVRIEFTDEDRQYVLELERA